MRMSRRTMLLVAIYLGIGAVTAAHYLTDPHAHQLHDIYRRLYYLPIILAAFLHGWRGGLIAAIVTCIAYAPHAMGHISHDPASDTQKVLEMVLYLTIGLVTGSLASRLQRTQRRLEATAGDLRQSLEQLRSAEESLVREARLAAVGRLSAGLAHEIRNPLASIKGSAELLADDFTEEHPKHRLLRVLVRESERLNGVLTRFLAFARPAPPQRTKVSIDQELEEVIALLAGRPERVEIRIDPVSRRGLQVWADAQQLRQVFLNVLLNAVQASGPGGEVVVRCSAAEGRAGIAILDCGPGFSQEALANAFTPYYSTREDGTGLGLAISFRIVEQHGGSIQLRNRAEGGAMVQIMLPMEAAMNPTVRPEPGAEA